MARTNLFSERLRYLAEDVRCPRSYAFWSRMCDAVDVLWCDRRSGVLPH